MPGGIPSALEPLRAKALQAILRVSFAEVYADLSAVPTDSERPVVLALNHVCVYDASIGMLICDALGRHMWLAAAAPIVEAVPSLRRLGFFGVRRDDPLSTARQLSAIGRAAKGSRRQAIVFFPEGGHVRPGLPVATERGLLAVARAADAPIVPVALAYEFFEGARPFVFAKALDPVHAGAGARVDLRRLLDEARASLTSDLLTGTGRYAPLVRRDARILLVDNVPLNTRRIGRASGPLYRQLVRSNSREGVVHDRPHPLPSPLRRSRADG